MFRRRDRRPVLEIAREWIAPRRGWRRVIDYWRHRMQRLPDSPTRIALGFACGVQASFTPFFGFHFMIAAALAWVLRGNILASAIGTFVGNPLTFPFIAGSSLWMGELLLGQPIEIDFTTMGFADMVSHLAANIWSVMLPWFLGGLIPGLLVSAAFYFAVKPLVVRYQARRKAKLIARARARIEAIRGAAE